ncbi:hypothetical protein [Salinigranum halophilum]|uniref:hypothetical protein n=1 Tax=Salinigranum halophilum TaxID=2565931 RepID=UPI0010A7B8F2|nr:hypothetical protein [Salinigranum halophilum]
MDSTTKAAELAERRLSQQVEVMMQNRNHSIEVIKIDLLLLTGLAAITRLVSVPASITLVFGGIPLLLSIGTSILVYLNINPILGLNHEEIPRLAEKNSANQVLTEVYPDWIGENHTEINRNRKYTVASLMLTTTSLGALATIILLY